MAESGVLGFVLVLLGGVCQGSFMLPTKGMGEWAWENYWLIFAVTAYFVFPWSIAFLTVPHLIEVYSGASVPALLLALLFGTAWGIGAVTFGLGVDALGLALGFAIIVGVAAIAGTVVPLLVQPPAAFTHAQALLTVSSLVLMLAGVVVCSFAGNWKEQQNENRSRSYRRGVAVCAASGLLSACGNLGFAFGTEISNRALQFGISESAAQNTLWTLLTLPLLGCNAGYAIYLLRRNRSTPNYAKAGAVRCIVLAIAMGGLWMAGMSLYGAGAKKLGGLGPTLGWAMLMSSMVAVASVLGIVSGEWRAAPVRNLRRLGMGIALLLLAIAGLAWANGLHTA